MEIRGVSSIVIPEFVDARRRPCVAASSTFSQAEIRKLLDTSQGGLYPLFRKCALAVLNSGAEHGQRQRDLRPLRDFDIQVVRHAWGIRLEIHNAPARPSSTVR